MKHRNHTYEGPYYTAEPKGKGELVYLDILGSLVKGRGGCAYVLLMVDEF